jgi:hypothetical protein
MPAGCKLLDLKPKEANVKSLNSENEKSPFLDSFDEAMEVVRDGLSDLTDKKEDNIPMSPIAYTLPKEINEPVWEMSIEAAERTLHYIYDELHHTCYMLVVKERKPTLYKLRTQGIPDYYAEKIVETAAEKPEFKAYVKEIPNLRILQCIIKGRGDEDSISAEYSRLFKEFSFNLPNGVYILNLTDAVLFRKDGRTPWGEQSRYAQGKMLPILGGSGAVGFNDIPIPNYDDVRIALGYTKLDKYITDWDAKKPKAVFRGTPSGCGTHEDTNMRIRLAESKIDKDILDAGITRTGEGSARFDPVHGLSVLTTTSKGVPRMNLVDQSKHKYMIHIDGNVAAYRLLQSMMTGSVQLIVKGRYTMWIDHMLEDGEHYISVKGDLSDLEEKIRWCIAHDEECRQISKNALQVASMFLERFFVENALARIFSDIKQKSTSSKKNTNGFLVSPVNSVSGGYKKTRRSKRKLLKRTTKRKLRLRR